MLEGWTRGRASPQNHTCGPVPSSAELPAAVDSTVAESDFGARARTWLAVFLVVGVTWRVVRYAVGFPVWGDEAALLLEIVERHDYADFLGPLGRAQVAPLGFLLAQCTVLQQFGASVYALRLFPLITGLVGVCLFARLSWRALSPLGGVAALGVLAAAHYATRYALDIKPYGTDLMVSALLLLLAVEWVRAPQERRWPIVLTLVAPIGLTLSFPAVFIAGAVGIVGLALRLQQKSSALDWVLFAAYVTSVATSFAGLLHLSAGPQYAAVMRAMTLWWERGFPPGNVVQFTLWLFDVHTAEMMSYPFGGKNGASTLTCILVLVGVRRLAKRREGTLLLLLGSSFALTFVAAILGRYPYGGSARVAQHLAPAICLLVGAGIEALVCALRSPARRRQAAAIVSAVLLLIAGGGIIRDVLHPYHAPRDRDLARLMSTWESTRRLDSGTLLMDPFPGLPWHVQWFVLKGVGFDRARLHSGPVDTALLTERPEWWVVNCDPRREGDPAISPRAQLSEGGFVLGRSLRLVMSHPLVHGAIVELQQWTRGASLAGPRG